MAIRIRLDRLLLERGMTLTELSMRLGIALANLSILKRGRGRAIRFSTLEALCRELACQPGDLLEFLPDASIEERQGDLDGAAPRPRNRQA